MTQLSEYERGRIDAIVEIFDSTTQGKDVMDKMSKMLDQITSMLQEFNKKYIKELSKK